MDPVVPIKLATTVMSAWISASSPMPLPAASLGLSLQGQMAKPLEVVIHDDNRGGIETKIVLERDGSYTDEMGKTIAHVFRCRTDYEKVIAKRTLSILAATSEHFGGKPIDLVSGYRVRRGEPWESPHRAARAIDFRIKGVPLPQIRDWLWTTYSNVGVGWYPGDQFIHIDSRDHDMSWTGMGGREYYKPYWADKARGIVPTPTQVRTRRRPGV
jgi:uncharacterized protein YcbK (DUF882 family)